jgi:hypothetical protein
MVLILSGHFFLKKMANIAFKLYLLVACFSHTTVQTVEALTKERSYQRPHNIRELGKTVPQRASVLKERTPCKKRWRDLSFIEKTSFSWSRPVLEIGKSRQIKVNYLSIEFDLLSFLLLRLAPFFLRCFCCFVFQCSS